MGAAPADAVGVARAVTGHRELRLHGLYTHFAVADEPARDDFTDGQLASLLGVAGALAADGIRPAMLHAANSAGAIAHPASRLDLVRCGVALYGHSPSPELAPAAASLRPACASDRNAR